MYHAVYGYYNPSTGLGYAEYMGAHIFTSMNLMIVLSSHSVSRSVWLL